MTIAIAAPSNRSARLRALAERHPYMTPLDIAKLTGEPLRLVQLALTREDDHAKANGLTVEATGPLSAAQVAQRTRMPIEVAKLFRAMMNARRRFDLIRTKAARMCPKLCPKLCPVVFGWSV